MIPYLGAPPSGSPHILRVGRAGVKGYHAPVSPVSTDRCSSGTSIRMATRRSPARSRNSPRDAVSRKPRCASVRPNACSIRAVSAARCPPRRTTAQLVAMTLPSSVPSRSCAFCVATTSDSGARAGRADRAAADVGRAHQPHRRRCGAGDGPDVPAPTTSARRSALRPQRARAACRAVRSRTRRNRP